MPRKPSHPSNARLASYAIRIRALREDHDLSQTEVAKEVSVHQRTYSDYERGKSRIPIDVLIALAKFYDTDMDYICGLSRTSEPFPKNPPTLY